VGSSVEVGGHTWKRVQTMGDCSRGAKALYVRDHEKGGLGARVAC
jgi:hypothetical protein